MDDLLARTARQQRGLLSRQQALQRSLTPAAIRHRLEGAWQRVLPGVYATFTGPLDDRHRQEAALLYAGPSSWLTGATVCRLREMRYVPAPDGTVDVLALEATRRVDAGFVRLSRTCRPPTTLLDVDGLRCVGVSRAAIACSRELTSLRDVRALLAEAVQRGFATPETLVAELEAGHSADSALPRRALDGIAAGCWSAPECELRELVMTSHLLPEARWNQPLPETGGIVPDACWPEARLVVEVDSAEWHRFGDAPERTERRRARLAALGYRVLPVSPRRLREDPAGVLREIEAAYLAGLAA